MTAEEQQQQQMTAEQAAEQRRKAREVTPEKAAEYERYYTKRTGPNFPTKSIFSPALINWNVVSAVLVPLAALLYHAYFVLIEQQGINPLVYYKEIIEAHPVYATATAMLILYIATVYYLTKKSPVYLVDFITLKSDPQFEVSHEYFIEVSRQFFDEDSLRFQEKILRSNCMSSRTAFPEGLHQNPPQQDMAAARMEADYVFKNTVGDLLRITKTNPKDIDILVVNCSLFCPTPSLASMIINTFGMRTDILSYSLGGMGCSAGVISIDLAKRLLAERPNSLALVVSTENITQNWYHGKDKAMLVSNTLFRMGGAAILLSNKSKDARRAKFVLEHTVRTHKGSDPTAYGSVFQEEDAEGKVGVRLSKQIMEVAAKAITTNITRLGPLVLPYSEQLKYAYYNMLRRKLLGHKIREFVPNFHTAFEHFCIHAGGRAVLDTIQKALSLTDRDMDPSRATLWRYGNVSSACIWYELEFIENSGRIKRGERVWQIAFGSGFKCNSAVWRRL
eukprot:GEZU01012496.1.p1 GENE.GEZU01012496.1~~GEZU01012496.1.p1  ORF type:complete len:505 (+),score=179.29 GEZU01012496.1:145-1659(+)